MDELNNILKLCASLRGVSRLPHRTLKEFSWFVESIILHEWDKHPDCEEYQVLKKYYDRIEFMNDPDALLGWSKLFLEYCRDQYLDSYKKEIEELETFKNEV
jgi:hypothetical protein